MQYGELIHILQHVGKDPSRLIFEDELTGIHNRRFLLGYFEHKVRWDQPDDFPLAMLLIDVDLFKAINDNYGHDVGDQALIRVAEMLKEVAGEEGFPVRYAGDEFVLLLPQADVSRAQQEALRVGQLAKERPVKVPGGKGEILISLSIGVASAPADAKTAEELIRKADMALYTAKKLGRNRVATTAEIDPQKTFPKAALHRLTKAQIAGRSRELAVISDALGGLSLSQSKLILLEGAPGMGKSTILDTVSRSLAGNQLFRLAKLSGKPAEGYRPYYLIGQCIVALMQAREDQGAAAVESLSEEASRYFVHVLPGWEGESEQKADSSADASLNREGIFLTIVEVMAKLADGKPLVLLADDLQFADGASLILLRVLISRKEIPVLVCGSVTERLEPTSEEDAAPWNRFIAQAHPLDIQKLQLKPLTAPDIGNHLKGVFPGITMPAGLEADLERVTQGNPLFLGEIVRKLVLDQKLSLVGQRWKIEPLEGGYLPRSIEEIVTEKIAALDEEERALLEQASTLGEDVPVSVLAGATEISESKVLAFLDRAHALGFLRMDFKMNDESLRFLSKRVLELTYGSIQPERLREIHERMGVYQEDLYQKKLGPSASILAYHFKRSANQEKASRYDQIKREHSEHTFDESEAENYTGDPRPEPMDPELDPESMDEDEEPRDDRLDAESLAKLPNLFRTLLTTVRSLRLYPTDSRPVRNAYRDSFKAAAALLEKLDHVSLSRSQGVLLANGHRVDAAEFRLLADSYLELLDRAELSGIELKAGLGEDELASLLTALGQLRPETIDPGYWKRFSTEKRLTHVQLHQMRYSAVRRQKSRTTDGTAPVGGAIDGEDLAEVPALLRAFMGAAKNIKLYPLSSQPVRSSIDQLHGCLQPFLSRRHVLTLAAAGESLLVNGTKLIPAGFETLAEKVHAFFSQSGLKSLSFLEELSPDELEIFVGALKDVPPDSEPTFWRELARDLNFRKIAFNDRRYSVSMVQTLLESGGSGPEEEEQDTELEDRVIHGPQEALVEALETMGKDLLVKGENRLAEKLMRRLFARFQEADLDGRSKILQGCRALFESLIQALQHHFALAASDPLLEALKQEEHPQILRELGNLLHEMTTSVLQFSDYALGSRIFSTLDERRRELAGKDGVKNPLEEILDRKIESSTHKLLVDDLRSGDPVRQKNAAQVLGGLQKSAVPLLVEVIKQEKDYRARQLAAGLLAEKGPTGAEQLKREVVLEVTSEQRFRILEVIDLVTSDLRTELAFCLSDVNAKVRRAAFRISERLNNKDVLELLVDFARHPDIGVAKGAIRSLANLQSAHAVGALVATLAVTREDERVIACSQALAQLSDPLAVPALVKVLTERKLYGLGRLRWDDQVRATAAFALGQIPGEEAKAALAKVADDADPRIRQIALARKFGEPRRSPTEDTDSAQEDADNDEGVA